MSALKSIVSGTKDLPSLPEVVHLVLAIIRDPNFSFSQLMRVISPDPGITAHVLRTCNSPYYGLLREVSSLQEALTYLGSHDLLQIVLSTQVVGYFRQGLEGYQLAKGDLWQHSMATALIGKQLAGQAGLDKPTTVFTAGLLHDSGKLVLSQYVQQQYADIEFLVKHDGKSFSEAEKEILGVDHAQVGGLIAKSWNFPAPILEAIMLHHKASQAKHSPQIVALVALANRISVDLGYGGGTPHSSPVLPKELLLQAGLGSLVWPQARAEMESLLGSAADLLVMAA